MTYTILDVDFNNHTHQTDFWKLLNEYATDIMGGGQAISETIKDKLPKERLDIIIKVLDENRRTFILEPHGQKYIDLCEAVIW